MSKKNKKRYTYTKKKHKNTAKKGGHRHSCAHCTDNYFCSPFKCQESISTPRYTSPNSRLNQEQLEHLQHWIEAANHLLLSLGTDSDPNNRRQLQLHFLKLKGAHVKAKVRCGPIESDDTHAKFNNGEKSKTQLLLKDGILATAGSNFIQINQTGSFVFILFDKLLSILSEECEHIRMHEPHFLHADCSTRRELTLNFGEFVAKKPELVNLFFGLPLYKMLHLYLGKDINVKTSEHPSLRSGVLTKVEEGKLQMETQNGQVDVELEHVCFLEIVNLR
ncbi:hypothetical protein R4Z10_17485 [Niallia sp. XMNu-256]|uniref:hypothetical protein n=1 Tax=Niallia sp. XMNu-256 TaxID=3082444 RepID=UPI0030D49A05